MRRKRGEAKPTKGVLVRLEVPDAARLRAIAEASGEAPTTMATKLLVAAIRGTELKDGAEEMRALSMAMAGVFDRLGRIERVNRLGARAAFRAAWIAQEIERTSDPEAWSKMASKLDEAIERAGLKG